MSLIIKKLTTSDLVEARQFITWNHEGDAEPNFPADEYLLRLLAQDNFYLLVAIEAEKIIGGLTAYELLMYQTASSEIFLYEIGVDNAHQRRKIASLLIAELKAICAEKGIGTMYVGTELDNVPARRLYETTGGNLETIAWYTYAVE